MEKHKEYGHPDDGPSPKSITTVRAYPALGLRHLGECIICAKFCVDPATPDTAGLAPEERGRNRPHRSGAGLSRR